MCIQCVIKYKQLKLNCESQCHPKDMSYLYPRMCYSWFIYRGNRQIYTMCSINVSEQKTFRYTLGRLSFILEISTKEELYFIYKYINDLNSQKENDIYW